jgi:DNA-directed RNA polymerase specialized sigma24 family protein
MHGMADRIIEALPRLRRHAYMLMGSRERADNYVHFCLEILVEESDRVFFRNDVQLRLFQFFHSILHMVEQNFSFYHVPEPDTDAHLHAAIGSLPAQSRAILLLTSTEGFSVAEASEILGIQETYGRELLARAHEALHRRLGVRVLIIEDQKDAAASLERSLEEMGHWVVGIADNEERALEMALEQRPELVVADVWLNGRDCGIKIAEHVCSSTAASALFVMTPASPPREQVRVDSSRMLPWPLNSETMRRKIARTCFQA